jgi:hypothetical protein
MTMSRVQVESLGVPRAVAMSSTATSLAVAYARIAVGAAFLSAVADRFGWWGVKGGWGSFAKFTAYTAQVNSFMPAATIPFLACAATAAEIVFGVLMVVVGVMGLVWRQQTPWMRWVAFGSAVLLALFGSAMAISFGLKSPLDYSVFSASACALLLAMYPDR